MRIEDYAVIGDTQTAAIVGRDGSIDWLCLPRFDSAACFASLLGTPENGRWLIAPADPVRAVRRRYLDDTAVLVTEFETGTGVVELVDAMPIRQTEPDVIRIARCVRGTVNMQLELIVRFDYGSVVPWVRTIDGVLRAVGGPDAIALWTPVELRGEGLTTRASFTLREGEAVPFVLMWHPSHEPLPKPVDAIAALSDTIDWWQTWSAKCSYRGEWRDAVVRSMITLKMLTFAPTGGIVAAVTTSVPEAIGGERNWDYRFCWIRDATFTLYSLMIAGYTDEAVAWRNWLLRAAAGDATKLQTLYGVAGERRQPELILDWLPGYEQSRPVRIGNAAVDQRQLDIYGELLDALYVARKAGINADGPAWSLEKVLLQFLTTAWREPDEGIWEVRGPRRHFTHSKVMSWVAFDRAVKAVEQFHLEGPVDEWRATRDEIHAQVCREAFNTDINAFTQYYGSSAADASLLLIPLVGFLPATDPRVLGTVAHVERDLIEDGYVRRYRTIGREQVDGLPAGEGTFLACSFWLADNYALQGRVDEARALFERLLAIRNDVGLLAEEYDPRLERQLGNFPQAFSHVSLVNTVFNLTRPIGPAKDRHTS